MGRVATTGYKLCPAPKNYAKVIGSQVTSTRVAAMIQASPTTIQVDDDNDAARSVEGQDGKSLAVERQLRGKLLVVPFSN